VARLQKNLYAGTSLVVGTIVTSVTRRAKFPRAWHEPSLCREFFGNRRHFQRTIRYSADNYVEMVMGAIIEAQGSVSLPLDYQEGKKSRS